MKIDYNKALKYMGVEKLTKDLESVMQLAQKELLKIATPRKLAMNFSTRKVDGYYLIEGANITLKSEDINNLFRDIEHISIIAVTLGIAVDKRIEYYARCDKLKMLVLDALASVYVEEIADSFTSEVNKNFGDFYPTVRYAPGYGDLDISIQKDILSVLDANKKLGIMLSDTFLMTPLKSTTGIVGYSRKIQPQFFDCGNCRLSRCGGENCPRRLR